MSTTAACTEAQRNVEVWVVTMIAEATAAGPMEFLLGCNDPLGDCVSDWPVLGLTILVVLALMVFDTSQCAYVFYRC